MEDQQAIEIIRARDTALSNQGNFRSLWQDTSDYIYPMENRIVSLGTEGEDKSRLLYDSTAIFDAQDMASGLSAAMMPGGQKFFDLTIQDEKLAELDEVDHWLSLATEIAHIEIQNSNLALQINETLKSLVVFGTGCLFSEWNFAKRILNYKDFAISKYQIVEDEYGLIDTIYLTFYLQPIQAIRKYGESNLSNKLIEEAGKPEGIGKKYEFIQVVRPRMNRNHKFKDNLNMKYESVIVEVAGKNKVAEGGFDEFPFAVPRWQKSSDETYGRGQGTESLAEVKMLQQMCKDYIDLCNKYANPPLLLHESFDGVVRTWPSAVNKVFQMDAIRAIPQDVLGNFPITDKCLEAQRDLIHKRFFRDVFWQLTSLTGDRRTTVEINERIQESLQRLASPVARLQTELFKPLITRSVLLMIRNGKIPYPPIQMQGADMGLEFQGRLVLALKQQQAKGFIQFAGVLSQMSMLYPEALDTVNVDKAMPDIARAFGVKTEHLATAEQMNAKRQARAQQQAAAQMLQAAQGASEAYQKSTKSPEEGSAAAALMNTEAA